MDTKPAQPKPIISEGKKNSGGHVTPQAGWVARRIRQQAQREARKKKPIEESASDTSPSLIPMQPRSWVRRGVNLVRNSPEQVELKRVTDRVRPTGVVWMSWRWVSGLLTVILSMMLIGLLTSDAFYVSTVSVGGVNYLTREEVFRFSGVSQKHIFWVDPAEVEAELESNNNIAHAEVRIGFPPRMVQILIQERDPVLTWEQDTDRVWVDINGLVMFQREDRPDLLRIVYDPNAPESQIPITPQTRMDIEIIHGALLLKSRLPSIDVLLYNPIKGLGWRDPRGWMAWFGIGDNMAMKAHVYEALVAYNSEAIQFGEINIADPDNPVYTILWQKSESLDGQ